MLNRVRQIPSFCKILICVENGLKWDPEELLNPQSQAWRKPSRLKESGWNEVIEHNIEDDECNLDCANCKFPVN